MKFVSGGAFVPEAVSFVSAMETRHFGKAVHPDGFARQNRKLCSGI
jgi:hypothetical protein